MLCVKIEAWTSHSPKTLVRTAVQAYWITMFTTNGNLCDLQERLLFAHENMFVNMLGVKIAA